MPSFLNPISWLRWIGQFVGGWFVSLPLRESPKTVVALAIGIFLMVCTIAASSDSNDWRGRLMDKQFAAAWERDDFETAELVLSRKISRTPDDAALIRRLALTKENLGEEEQAIQLMTRLFETKRDARAADWLLRNRFVGSSWPDLSDVEKGQFRDILVLLNREYPNEMEYKNIYANYLIANQEFGKAIPLLTELARKQPMRGLQAAALARRLKNKPMATQLAKRTLERVDEMLEENPTNSILALAVAQNQIFLKRFEDAIQTLDLGINRAKKPENKAQLRQAMGDALIAWVANIENRSREVTAASAIYEQEVLLEDRIKIMGLLEIALRYAPKNPRVLTAVADQVLATLNEEEPQLNALRKTLVRGSSPGIAHFIRGTAYLMRDDFEKAERFLQMASRELPRSGAILNNLAVVLTLKGEQFLEEALVISQSAIEQTPRPTPHFFETRGQILYRMGRYVDAIPDLEKALRLKSLAPKAHESLAVSYEKIGDPEMAKEHRDAIAALNEKVKEEKLDLFNEGKRRKVAAADSAKGPSEESEDVEAPATMDNPTIDIFGGAVSNEPASKGLLDASALESQSGAGQKLDVFKEVEKGGDGDLLKPIEPAKKASPGTGEPAKSSGSGSVEPKKEKASPAKSDS